MKKYWLFEEIEGMHCKLGDAEVLIPIVDRKDILDAIPHGWRMTRYDDSQWTFSRLMSLSIPHRILRLVEAVANATASNPWVDSKQEESVPRGWSSTQNALFTVGPEDDKPLLSIIHNVLRHASGSCSVYTDKAEDVKKDIANFSKPDPIHARDELMSLELGMVIPTVSSLELHDIVALRDSVLDQGFPVHPSFDGEALACGAGGLMALHLALRAIKTCADAACTCMYNTIEMREWWYNRAYQIGSVESVRVLSDFSRQAKVDVSFPEMMTVLCVRVASSLYPNVTLAGMFMRDILPVCVNTIMFGIEKRSHSSIVENYATYLCRDDDSVEQVFDYMSAVIAGACAMGKISDDVDIPDSERIFSLLSNDKACEAFVEFSPFSAMVSDNMRRGEYLLSASKERIGSLLSAIPEELLQLIFGDALLVDEYRKFANKKVELDTTLLAPNSVLEGEGSLACIMEGL